MNLEDLSPFCSEDEVGYATPFSVGKWTYATDGKIIIRVPCCNWATPHNERKNLAEKFEQMFNCHADRPGVTLPFVCGNCRGSGGVKCPTCQHVNPCPTCEQIGFIAPDQPFPKRAAGPEIPFGVQRFAAHQLRKIAVLPGLRCYPATTYDEREVPMPFRFSGGSGVLAPMKAD